ncbi:hypothetical protein BDU57DRAFT_564455 [Ampelomyces quisqualis]|uniref:Uncharacterized protein n=1 Tax=Ampelomyces quisqualis TaxID=50730 RepID=A0A6A5R8C7_AMPQU|nr:hypothetical protein BDU57DRAFT_564455 [Ampelomyces quisqualis]
MTLELGAVSPGQNSATEVWIKARLYFQKAQHPFLEKSPVGLETHDDDDAFEIDCNTASDDKADDPVGANPATTIIGSRTSCSVTRWWINASSKAGSKPFGEDPEDFDAFSTTQSAFEPQIPVTPPHLTSLFMLGKLVAALIDKDWAFISIDAPIVEPTLRASKDQLLTVESFAPTPRDTVIVKMTTASHGSLAGRLSAWPSYTCLPHSKTIQKIYVVRFDGCLADGDCGFVVVDVGYEEINGHLVAGCQTTGSAHVLAASEAVKDI